MKKILIVLLGLSLFSCKVSVEDKNGDTQRFEVTASDLVAIADNIEDNLEKIDMNLQKTHEDSKGPADIVDDNSVSIRSDGKSYGIQEYVNLKMEWAYFQGQKEAINGDVRITNSSGCWEWTKSPWDGQSISTIIYNPECKGDDNIREEVEDRDIYDTEF